MTITIIILKNDYNNNNWILGQVLLSTPNWYESMPHMAAGPAQTDSWHSHAQFACEADAEPPESVALIGRLSICLFMT